MFGCNFLGCSIRRIVHHRYLLAMVDMGHNLVPEREKCILMGFLVLMDVDRRYFERIVTVGVYFFVGGSFVVFLDVNHQHMEME